MLEALFRGEIRVELDGNFASHASVHFESKGEVFASAVMFVLQQEMLAVHPPRSTARWVRPVLPQSLFRAFAQREIGSLGMSGLRLSDSEAEEDAEPRTPSSDGTGTVDEDARRESGRVPESPEGSKPQQRPKARAEQHACVLCKQVFTRRNNLQRHVQAVHEGKKNEACEVCGRKFAQRYHLQDHMRVVHGEGSAHACDVCEKQFGSRSKLVRHRRTVHEKEREFVCGVCGRSFGESGHLKRHMNGVHGSSTSS